MLTVINPILRGLILGGEGMKVENNMGCSPVWTQ